MIVHSTDLYRAENIPIVYICGLSKLLGALRTESSRHEWGIRRLRNWWTLMHIADTV
jgi:hypothetical protein